MRTAWTPSIVPSVGDVTVYLVEDDFGKIGRCYRETDSEKADLEATIQDLISGQYNDPIRVVAFNTVEGWSQDVSEDVAREIQRRHDIIAEDVPSHLSRFVEVQIGSSRQLALSLV
ncbi:hypothetical protein ASC80_10640 [Afipia sp. Root123D2]|uniref:hypothetical protein n=1 Tax=Afipia sp. Root123D2 TaxID=1736436 RepID=UPI0006F66939|nr:hypothetical protein [Afipia sp. Root123D2]KQW20674.1 hypothetical protein ASC80_10640 [Afipia sp. Root123D2]